MEKRSNKGFVITIVILSMLLVGVSGYLVYDKFLSGNQEQKTDNKEDTKGDEVEVKEAAISQSEIESIMNVIYNIPSEVNSVESFNALDNQVKLRMGYSLVVQAKQGNEVKGSEIVEALKSIYGDKVTISLEDITCEICGKKSFIYNKNNDKYTDEDGSIHLGHGAIAEDYISNNSYFESIIKSGNEYKVVVKKVFSYNKACELGPCDNNIKVYKNAEDAKNNKNLILDTAQSNNNSKYCVGYDDDSLKGMTASCDLEKIYKDNKDKFDSYIYTFVLEDGNYVLQSMTTEEK